VPLANYDKDQTMSNTANNLRDKTDEELIGMMRKLALEMDRIGEEQKRRTALKSRETSVARDNEENEGGLSDV
jgi:hypothetical protein